MISNTYYIAFLLYAAAFFLYLFRFKRSEFGTGLAAFSLNGITLILLCSASGQLPVFTLFEGFLLAAFILGGLGLISLGMKDHHPGIRRWIWLEILVLFLILLVIPKQTTLSAYDHDYPLIILFHLFRVIAFALMLYSSACFIQVRVQRKTERNENARALSHRARNFLIMSAVFFLSGEYVGIIWSQNGWGDFWHWTSGFFQSTLIVLYLMIALHIPGKGRRAEAVRSLVGGLGGFIMTAMMLFRSFY